MPDPKSKPSKEYENAEYADIMHMNPPDSECHARMSGVQRAAQFAPFAALVGFGDVISEAARFTDSPITLTEDEISEIDRSLRFLSENISLSPTVKLKFYVPDKSKCGGSFLEICDRVTAVDEQLSLLVLASGDSVPFRNIVSLEPDNRFAEP